MADPEYVEHRVDSADNTILLTRAMQLYMPQAKRDVHVVVQTAISECLLGLIPSAFRNLHNINDKYNAPDFMIKDQLHARRSLQAALILDLKKPTKGFMGSDGRAFVRHVVAKCQHASKIFDSFHGMYQEPGQLADVRRAQTTPMIQGPSVINNTFTINNGHNTINAGR